MALNTRKSAMNTKKLVAEFFPHGRDTNENFLNSPDSAVTAMKSPSALIPLGVGAGSAGADVMLLSNDNLLVSYTEKFDRCRADCKILRKTALRRKYPSEAIAHRNMLARSKPHVSARFRKFPEFLFEVGPKPFPGASLDRIDNSDPEYAPRKVRWADAHTQSNNRSTSRLFDDPDGNQYTVAELAKRQGVSPNAIHQRLRRGWSYAEVVAGDRSSLGPSSPAGPTSAVIDQAKDPTIFVTIPDLKPVWLQAMDAAHEGQWHDLSAREKKGLREIAERCSGPGLRYYVEDVVRYAIKNWSRFTARAKSEEGAYGMPHKPTVDFLHKYIRAAVNLYLEKNGLEFTGSAVRPKEQSITPALEPAPVAPKYEEMPYEPPGMFYGPGTEQRDAERYVEKFLKHYHAEYTRTGNLPPPECRDLSNAPAILSYFISAGLAMTWEEAFGEDDEEHGS
jgi:hypothetical protein